MLLGLLPPLLYATAIQTSLVDFNANRRPILLLSVGLVVFTAAGVGVVVHALLPGISLAAAFAIGAVVAPPDAVAATAIAPQDRAATPHRDDPRGRVAAQRRDRPGGAADRDRRSVGHASRSSRSAWTSRVAAGGGVLLGLATFFVVAWVRKHVTDTLLDTAISLVTPFAAYIVAEELHASGVLAVVVAGLLLGHKAPILQTAQSRIAERTNWRTIAFVLENTVFLLIGLQARWILEDVSNSELSTGRIVAVCAASLLAVIVLRLAVGLPGALPAGPAQGRCRDRARRRRGRYTFILGWAGMRGVVTLAAAFVIPESTEHREILLLIAFTVVAGTLFLQGLTLPWVAAG